jgi:hypothetical protein
MLELTPKQAGSTRPGANRLLRGAPGPVDRRSAPEVKGDFFAALFATRTDVYATRWGNTRTGKAGGLMPLIARNSMKSVTVLVVVSIAAMGAFELMT